MSRLIRPLILAVALAACATPERHSLVLGPDRLAVHAERGWQLAWGERADRLTPRKVESGIGKRTLGIAGGAVAGGLIGVLSGRPAAGAAVGTAAGALAEALDRSRVKEPRHD